MTRIYTIEHLTSPADFRCLGFALPTDEMADTGWAVVELDGDTRMGIEWYADFFAAIDHVAGLREDEYGVRIC